MLYFLCYTLVGAISILVKWAMDAEIKAAYKRRLKHLQIKAALRGIDTPPEVLIEIEDIEKVIKKNLLSFSQNWRKP